jgi:RNA polymerase sigma factor (sigma-70 family)
MSHEAVPADLQVMWWISATATATMPRPMTGGIAWVGPDEPSIAPGNRAAPRAPSDARPSFDAFFRSAYRPLLRLAMYAGATEQEGHDAVAAAMEEIFRRWDDVDSPLRYGRAATLNNLRKLKTRGLSRIRRRLAERGAVAESVQDRALDAWEDRQWVVQLLGDLPTAQRNVMALVVDGLTTDEIAGLLGKTPAAVRKNLQLARRRLAAALGRGCERDRGPDRRPTPSTTPEEAI